MSTELQTRPTVTMSLQLTNMGEIREFCKVLANTDMVPKSYKGKPDDIFVAVLHGQEVGLPHLQALQSIATINGIPSIYGDAGLALVRTSGKLEDFDEWFEVDGVRQAGSSFPIQQWADEGKQIVAHCFSQRVGAKRPRKTTYSVGDAKRAGLWDKAGPWTTAPQRMLMFRARGWNLRDEFGDVLKGLAFAEEAMDIDTAPGPDGAYRPVVVATVDEDQADLADVQAKLKAQREQVQGDGPAPTGGSGDAASDLPGGRGQQSQDAPAPKPAEKPVLVDPFKAPTNGKPAGTAPERIPTDQWEHIMSFVRMHADLNDLRMDWEKTNKVKNSNNLNVAGQQAFLAVMRAQTTVEFPY